MKSLLVNLKGGSNGCSSSDYQYLLSLSSQHKFVPDVVISDADDIIIIILLWP